MYTQKECAQIQHLFMHKRDLHLCTNGKWNCAQTKVAFVHNFETPTSKGIKRGKTEIIRLLRKRKI